MYKEITNHYDPGLKRPKLCCEKQVLFEPGEGREFAHHSRLAEFKGKLYCMFTNGHVNEDDVGQHIMYCVAEEFDAWSAPMTLAPPWPGEKRPAVLSPSGWYVHGDTLVAYFGVLEYNDDRIVNGHRLPGSQGRTSKGMKYITSTDGLTWSEPADLGAGFGGNHNPQPLQSGRLLFPGGRTNLYSDNPDGIHGWVRVEGFPAGYPNNDEFDNGEGVDTSSGLVGQTVGLCEGSFVELDDGRLFMMLRSGTDYLWASESVDGGETWSLPQPTRFTDNRTKFHFGRLPNGKYYYVGTPDPFPPRTRHVLGLSLSEDGLDYRQHFILEDDQYKGRYPGIDKNGIYGYPSTLVKDGYLYASVSICKETIIVLRVPCDTL